MLRNKISYKFSRKTVHKYKTKTTVKTTNQWKAMGDGHRPNKEKRYLSVKDQWNWQCLNLLCVCVCMQKNHKDAHLDINSVWINKIMVPQIHPYTPMDKGFSNLNNDDIFHT